MNILKVRYDNITFKEAIKKAISLVDANNKSNIFFVNIDCLYKAQSDNEYRNALTSASLILPDGIGLKLLTRIIGGRMKENCNGSDFSPIFMSKAVKRGYKIFFLGGKDNVAQKAADNMRKKIPGIQIVGTHEGYFNSEEDVINKINDSLADILFVAMGVPLQEKWIARNRNKLNPKLCLGVGALFDYLSGTIKRAPKFIQIIKLEWLWRVIMEPKRLWKRYLVDDMKFFWLVLKQKLKK